MAPIFSMPVVEKDKSIEKIAEQSLPSFSIQKQTSPKYITLIYGRKGTGKTNLAMGTVGKNHAALFSFDGMSFPIFQAYHSDKAIDIYDVSVMLDSTTGERYLETSKRLKDGLIDFIGKLQDIDIVIFDGLEILIEVCEMAMRYERNIPFGAGVPHTNWKFRRLYLKQIFNQAMKVAKKGVIATTYPRFVDKMVDEAQLEDIEVPNWVDIIQYQTAFVIRTLAHKKANTIEFYARVESSKFPSVLPTGNLINVTNNVGVFARIYE